MRLIIDIPEEDYKFIKSLHSMIISGRGNCKSIQKNVINAIRNGTLLDKSAPQGEWINHRNDYGNNIADCSLCGKAMQWHDEDEDGTPRYCWYCGAKMKGVKKNE